MELCRASRIPDWKFRPESAASWRLPTEIRMRERATSMLVLTVLIGGVVVDGGQSVHQSGTEAFIRRLGYVTVVIDDDDDALGLMIFDGQVVRRWRMHGARHGTYSQRKRRTERAGHGERQSRAVTVVADRRRWTGLAGTGRTANRRPARRDDNKLQINYVSLRKWYSCAFFLILFSLTVRWLETKGKGTGNFRCGTEQIPK